MFGRPTGIFLLILLSQNSSWSTAAAQDGPIVSIAPRVRPEPVANYAAYPHADLRIDVPLILIPVHVTTQLGTSVTDLRQENFRVFEDGIEQPVTNFAKEDAPVSIGMLFDSSGSMHTKIHKSAEAAAAFFKVANPEDEFFLVEFNDRPRLSVPFTRDSDEIHDRIARVRAMGRTSLLDAIHLALAQMKHAHNLRKAIVIFSDGGDNRSRFTEREVKKAMLESDVQVYAMGIFDLNDSRKLTREEVDGPRLLTELAEETGGKHFPVDHLDDLPKVCDRIGNELRNQYLLGYMPANAARDGRYRKIKVVLANTESRPQLKPFYRQGYYAPLQ
jgi:Ca-activated chloride channel family protein